MTLIGDYIHKHTNCTYERSFKDLPVQNRSFRVLALTFTRWMYRDCSR